MNNNIMDLITPEVIAEMDAQANRMAARITELETENAELRRQVQQSEIARLDAADVRFHNQVAELVQGK